MVAALQGLQPHLHLVQRVGAAAVVAAPARGESRAISAWTAAGTVARGLWRRVTTTIRAAASAVPTASRSDSATSVVTTPSGRAPETARAGATTSSTCDGVSSRARRVEQPAGVRGQGQAGHGDVAGEHGALAQVPDDLGEALHHGRREAEDHGGDEHGTRQHALVEGPHRHQAEQRRHGDRPPPGEGQQGPAERPGKQRHHALGDRLEGGAGHREHRERDRQAQHRARQQAQVGHDDEDGDGDGGRAAGPRRDPLGPGQHDPGGSGHERLRRCRGRPGRTPPRRGRRRSGWPPARCATSRARPARPGARR